MESINSLPTTNPDSYEVQAGNNNALATQLFDQIFPGFFNLIDVETLFEMIAFLSETRVNPRIIPRVIRGISNIMMGTQNGQVIVHVHGDMMNVSVRETDGEIKVKS